MNKVFYRSKRWQRKRELILKRDEYICQQCKRYGKLTPATTIHHIIPITEREDLRLDSRNLISLCAMHHEQMHVKQHDSLSDTGAEMRDRLIRKFPNL